MEGKTTRGRPLREWLEEVKEWCNEEMYIRIEKKGGLR